MGGSPGSPAGPSGSGVRLELHSIMGFGCRVRGPDLWSRQALVCLYVCPCVSVCMRMCTCICVFPHLPHTFSHDLNPMYVYVCVRAHASVHRRP